MVVVVVVVVLLASLVPFLVRGIAPSARTSQNFQLPLKVYGFAPTESRKES
jgi:hypothetical protein